MEQIKEVYGIPGIAAICYGVIELIKALVPEDEKIKNIYPLISALIGAFLGMALYLIDSNSMVAGSAVGAIVAGVVSGLSATGGNQIIKRLSKKNINKIDDFSPDKYYITGDKHGDFSEVVKFCKENNLRKNDVIVVLGDSGFNYFGDERDNKLKARVSALNVKVLSIHGNKENRPQNISTYGIRTFLGGTVYYEPKYPNLLFAKDGEVYNFNGREFMVIGGAHSVDKVRCLEEGLPYWEDEMPDEAVKNTVEAKLSERENKIYGFLTHTCPISCIPTEMFLSTRRAATSNNKKSKAKSSIFHRIRSIRGKNIEYPLDIDRSMEEWLEELKEKTDYTKWYCGHYHVDKEINNISMMKSEINPFCLEGD